MNLVPIKRRRVVAPPLPSTGLVWVYGTLKRGCGNSHHLEGVEFVGEATTAAALPLVVHGLPYLFNRPGTGYQVKGEVYRVTTPEIMARLDKLEGHPGFYYRTTIKVMLAGVETEVFVYFINQSDVEFDPTEFKAEYRRDTR